MITLLALAYCSNLRNFVIVPKLSPEINSDSDADKHAQSIFTVAPRTLMDQYYGFIKDMSMPIYSKVTLQAAACLFGRKLYRLSLILLLFSWMVLTDMTLVYLQNYVTRLVRERVHYCSMVLIGQMLRNTVRIKTKA